MGKKYYWDLDKDNITTVVNFRTTLRYVISEELQVSFQTLFMLPNKILRLVLLEGAQALERDLVWNSSSATHSCVILSSCPHYSVLQFYNRKNWGDTHTYLTASVWYFNETISRKMPHVAQGMCSVLRRCCFSTPWSLCRSESN